MSHGPPCAKPPSMGVAVRKGGDALHPTLAVPLTRGEAGQRVDPRERSSQTFVRGEGPANSASVS